MRFAIVAVVVGVAAGLLAGGRLSNAGDQPVRGVAVLASGVALQLLAQMADVGGSAGLVLVLGSYVLLATFAVVNLRMWGMPIVLLGLLMNAVVITVNGGMPVRGSAIVAAGIADADEVAELDFGAKHHLERQRDDLVVLADILPVRPLREVLSYGDLVASFGVANVIYRRLRPRRVRAGLARSDQISNGPGDTGGHLRDAVRRCPDSGQAAR